MKRIPLRPLTTSRVIATTPEIDQLIAADAPVAIGVSGGKDSSAVAAATNQYLDAKKHKGHRLLVHADLGVTEWADSMPTCERLAKHLGLDLLVVKRPKGDMMDRWEQRWKDNVARWETLSCVKLILPWSTPDMRFCTSEMKVDQITRALFKRWSNSTIINATGVRREESTERAKALISKPQKKLTSKTFNTTGVDWLPIADWTLEDVLSFLREHGIDLHEAYTVFGTSRVSCVWCILATLSDHLAAAKDARNHALGRRMCELEARSTFAFQGNRWLSDTLRDTLQLDPAVLKKVKLKVEARETAESVIPKHLLYTKGWPTCVPTKEEAEMLSWVRRGVATAVGLQMTFIKPEEIRARYTELMAEKAAAKPKRL